MQKNIIIIWTIIAVLALAGLAFYYFQPGQLPAVSQYPSLNSKAEGLVRDGKFTEAVSVYENALKAAENTSEMAEAESNVSWFAYRAGDFDKASNTFKKIISNSTYPAITRAAAVRDLADLLMIYRGQPGKNSKYFKTVFSSEPYSTFVTEDTSAKTSFRKLYAYALTFSSDMPAPLLRVAEINLYRVLNNDALDKKTKDGYIKKAKKSLDTVSEGLGALEITSPDKNLAYTYWLKGLVLSYLYQIEKDMNFAADSAASFDFARKILTKSEIFSSVENLRWADFYYADLLSKAYGTSKNKLISELLAEIAANSRANSGFDIFIKNNADGSDEVLTKQAVTLSGKSPEFKSFLQKQGWKIK